MVLYYMTLEEDKVSQMLQKYLNQAILQSLSLCQVS